jgi:hypothetical protein
MQICPAPYSNCLAARRDLKSAKHNGSELGGADFQGADVTDNAVRRQVIFALLMDGKVNAEATVPAR